MSVISLGKRMIPSRLRPAIADIYHGFRLGSAATKTRLQNLVVDHLILSNWVGRKAHFRIFSPAFSREHLAVAAGRKSYLADRKKAQQSSYLLRRNIHRIEKGLIARVSRSVFAQDYIEETLDEFEAVCRASRTPNENSEITWAADVLSEYFAKVQIRDSKLSAVFERFNCIDWSQSVGRTCGPFQRDLTSEPITIDAFQALCVRRRSVRHYKPEPVDRDLLDKAMSAARMAPSACNRQAFSFEVFDDPNMARKVASIPMGTKSFVEEIPAIIVVVGHLRAYPFPRDRHAIYVDASLAAMSLVYGLETQGVASCIINWADENPQEKQIAKLLNLAPDDRVVMMMSYGWPDPEARVPYSAKRSVDDIRHFREAL